MISTCHETQSVTQKKPSPQEVGEDSKLARSFERIRSIVRRRRLARKEKKYPKLEQIVNDVMAQQIAEKKRIRSSNKHYLTVEFQQKSLYRHSYQVGWGLKQLKATLRLHFGPFLSVPGITKSTDFGIRLRVWHSLEDPRLAETDFGQCRDIAGSQGGGPGSVGQECAFREEIFASNVFRFRHATKR